MKISENNSDFLGQAQDRPFDKRGGEIGAAAPPLGSRSLIGVGDRLHGNDGGGDGVSVGGCHGEARIARGAGVEEEGGGRGGREDCGCDGDTVFVSDWGTLGGGVVSVGAVREPPPRLD